MIPVPEKLSGGYENLEGSVVWFPVVGLVLGLIAFMADFLFFSFFPPLLRSASCMLIFVFISKALHLDGLADTADGFLSSRPRERILEIMRDSRIGTMGAAAVSGIMILKTAAIYSLGMDARSEALILAPMAGRGSMVIIMAFFEYARNEGGLASVFYKGTDANKGLVAGGLIMFSGAVFSGFEGIMIMMAFFLFIYSWGLYSKKTIGGFTGDTLGAGCELSEAFVLICFAIIS